MPGQCSECLAHVIGPTSWSVRPCPGLRVPDLLAPWHCTYGYRLKGRLDPTAKLWKSETLKRRIINQDDLSIYNLDNSPAMSPLSLTLSNNTGVTCLGFDVRRKRLMLTTRLCSLNPTFRIADLQTRL